MQLESITIARQLYGDDAGKLTGTVEFSGNHGRIKINLDEDTSREVVKLCADGIVRAARELSTNLIAETLDATDETLLLSSTNNDEEIPL